MSIHHEAVSGEPGTRPLDPNNCLGLAIANFVCFTYKKWAHRCASFGLGSAIRDRSTQAEFWASGALDEADRHPRRLATADRFSLRGGVMRRIGKVAATTLERVVKVPGLGKALPVAFEQGQAQ